jgi:hypothetical protein
MTRFLLRFARPAAVVGVLCAWTFLPVSAQPTNQDACRQVAEDVFGVEPTGGIACRVLAINVEDSIRTRLQHLSRAAAQQRLSPRDFQIPQGEVGNDAGTPLQGGSAPSIQSVALAGGNLAAAGTEAGTRTLATVALNPASLFAGPDGGNDRGANQKDSLSVALANLGDVTVVVPIEDIDATEALDYLGIRGRVNMTALVQGSPSFREVERQWLSTLRASGDLLDQIVPALRTKADDVAACTEALLRAPADGVREANDACNADFAPLSLSADDFARLRRLTEQALAEADDAYFGLDLRLDLGDPTLGVADGTRGTRLYAGVGWGRRYGAATSTRTTVRLHGGVKYVDLDAADDAVFAAEGGADLAFAKVVDKQRLEGSAGLSFSAGDVEEALEEAAETNVLRGRLSVNVPLAGNYGLSINFAAPIIGDVGTTLSVKTNWHLLLPGSPN